LVKLVQDLHFSLFKHRTRYGAPTTSRTQLFPTGRAEYLYPLPETSSMVSKPWPVAGAVPLMISHLVPTFGLYPLSKLTLSAPPTTFAYLFSESKVKAS
jgi:hypothetical protein